MRVTFTPSLVAAMLFAGHAGAADQLELKGYSIGEFMADCPQGSKQMDVTADEIHCDLGPTTIAETPASAMTLILIGRAVALVAVKLNERGRDAGLQVRLAITEKYGAPSVSKPHINTYEWQRGSLVLLFDGYAGTLALGDRDATRRRLNEKAKKATGDL